MADEKDLLTGFGAETLKTLTEQQYTYIMTVGLTENAFSVISGEKFFAKGDISGEYDAKVGAIAKRVRDDRQRGAFAETFGRESLLRSLAEGETERVMACRLYDDNGAVRLTELRIFTRLEKDGRASGIFVARALDAHALYTGVATALSDAYAAIYYVDLTDDSYIEFGQRGYFDNRGLEIIGEDFFAETRKNIDLILWPEDRGRMIAYMEKETLLHSMKDRLTPYIEYRLIIDGRPVWHRLRAVRPVGDTQHIIVTVAQVDDQVNALKRAEEESRRNMEIIGVLASEYSSVYYVDLETDRVTSYSKNEDAGKSFGAVVRGDACYSKAFRLFTERLVLPEDKPMMLRAGSVGNIVRELRGKKSFLTTYRDAGGRYSEMKFVKVGAEDGVPRGVALGFADKDAELRAAAEAALQKRRNMDIIGILASEYYAVYYLDLTTDELTAYSAETERSGGPAILDTARKYADAFRGYVQSWVFADDREQMLRAGSVYSIFRELRDKKTFSAVYRSVRNGAPRWCEMKMVKVGTEENPRAAVVCFADRDREIRADKEWREEIERVVAERTAELRQTYASLNRINDGVIDLLGNVVECRDETTGEHIYRVRGYTAILARQIMRDCPEYGLTEQRIGRIVSAAALHDVGKIAIPDSILRKPGRLTDEEYALMKTHSAKGCEILQNLSDKWDEEYLRLSMEICRSHHEKWDGGGYPDELSGDSIPIAAQIVSVADIFDALTTKRVYKDAYTPERAYEMIMEGRCGAFSEKMKRCITACRDLFAAQSRSAELLPEARLNEESGGFYVFAGADAVGR